ncbi:MAG: HlyD family efflux transporter periplasmic adaptor subunit [Hyphomicrobiaceae bacterium]
MAGPRAGEGTGVTARPGAPARGGADASDPGDDLQSAPLREDICLSPVGRDRYGAPQWVLSDPASGNHFQIGATVFAILSHWSLGEPRLIAAALARSTTLSVGESEVEAVAAFLAGNGLVRARAGALIERRRRSRSGVAAVASRLLGGSLMFRKLPLVRPERFLDATLPFVRPLMSRGFVILTLLVGLLGLLLAGREHATFAVSLAAMASPEGAAAVALALAVGKSVHELAHAYAARRHGVAVPSMGIALVVLLPVLYTETSAAWTLSSRRQRIEIAAAGVAAELLLAAFALFAAAIAEPGLARNALVFAATSLVLVSLAINGNPLMRFDGYFVLSEVVGLENLQQRALDLVVHHLRRLVSGDRVDTPEPGLPRGARLVLACYGAALLVYRPLLYGGIAVMLYAFGIKAVGALLGAAVVAFYVARPAMREMALWWRIAARRHGRLGGMLRLTLAGATVALPLFVPWRTTLTVPVLLEAGIVRDIYAPEPARMVRLGVRPGATIAAGAPLAELTSPELDLRIEADRASIAALRLVIARERTGSGSVEAALVRAADIERLSAELAGLEERQARLRLIAPVAGRAVEVVEGLGPGAWVTREQPLVRILMPGRPIVTGFVEERDLGSIRDGASARIRLEGLVAAGLEARVVAVRAEPVAAIEQPLIASVHGGPIPARLETGGHLVPEVTLYRVVLEPVGAWGDRDLPDRSTFGFASIETPARNLIGRIIERIVGLIRSEIG